MVAAAVVMWKNYYHGQSNASTVHRKFFHFLIAIVYLQGILLDFRLLFFSSAVVLFVFLVIEVSTNTTRHVDMPILAT